MHPELAWFRRRLLAWGEANRRPFPWRTTNRPFRILVAEVLLQRTRADAAAPVYRELFRRWPTASALARADVRAVARVIRPLGLSYRARRVRDLARAIDEQGRVPRDPAELARLAGVGRYVANATAAAAFGARVPTIDRVSARVYRRFFGLSETLPPATDKSLWLLAGEIVPKKPVREWNWSVLDLAAAVCTPRQPRCDDCPLQARCVSAG